jgi:hypothetical protein
MAGIPQRSPQGVTKGENGDAKMDTLGWLSQTIELLHQIVAAQSALNMDSIKV